MSEINFQCKKCGQIFNSDVGRVTFPTDIDRGTHPEFEKDICCPNCGFVTFRDEVELTVLGEIQLTEVFFTNREMKW